MTSSILRICWLSLSEVLIGVGLCGIFIGMSMRMFVSICVCTVFRKKREKEVCQLSPNQNFS